MMPVLCHRSFLQLYSSIAATHFETELSQRAFVVLVPCQGGGGGWVGEGVVAVMRLLLSSFCRAAVTVVCLCSPSSVCAGRLLTLFRDAPAGHWSLIGDRLER